MSYGAIGVAAIGGIISMSQGARNRRQARQLADEAKEERDAQQRRLEVQMKKYQNMQFKNPFANMENTFEDLTINQKEAEFASQQAAQQRANIMQQFKGAAGASGIAGLAQALANQGAIQTQRISATIGKQEAVNQALAAKGASAVQIAERQGDQYVQQLKADRQATMLGMQMGQSAGANAAAMQAQQNELNAMLAQQQTTANFFGGVASGMASSDEIGGETGNIFTKMKDGEEISIFKND